MSDYKQLSLQLHFDERERERERERVRRKKEETRRDLPQWGRDIGEAEIELGGTCHNNKPGHEGWGSWRKDEGRGGV